MWVVAQIAENVGALLPAIIGICGLGGIIFTALRYRRDDTTAVVTQQSTILSDMKTINDELRVTAIAMKQERDACRNEVSGLRGELREARNHLSGQMTDIQDRLDEGNGDNDFGQLTEQLQKGNEKTLQYSRKRFLATWLAVAVLAVLTCMALIAASNNAETDLSQTEEIAMLASDTADATAEQSDDIVAYMRGEQGIPGVPGTSGEDGTPGLPGGSGEQGPEGPKGEPGTAGATGPIGSVGAQGPQGPFGTLGPVGPVGAQGEPGQKGDKGDEGARGNEGPTGPQGPQGPPGTPPPFQVNTVIAIGQSANDTNPTKTANATCTTGRASGGGFAVNPSDPGIIVTASSPVGNTGWNATAEVLSLPPGTNWQIFAFVTCVSGGGT